jgi:hypothetical protein
MALTLAQIDTAIADVLTKGQSTSMDGVTYTRANLNALMQMRQMQSGTEPRTTGKRPVFRSFNMSGAAN